ncbi:actin filament-associated protein 1-like 2 [Terrapene carolina triunguis]|uniref:actin filament-associated protein 1-like 2 n=1 Tax=Terrapene triunguis TaxID=2587831 RepID=UPI001156595B|nr:actin filament-associated protein 1-like 2 [Terrapene carolina triunguis]
MEKQKGNCCWDIEQTQLLFGARIWRAPSTVYGPDLDKLLLDLESFLLILDRENLSYIAQAKKKSIAELLSRFQSPPSEDAEYMIMRCISPSSGSSAFQTPADLSPRQAISSPDPMGRGECDLPAANGQCSSGGTNPLGILPHLPSLPAEDSYEEAEPINPKGHMSPAGGGDTDSSHYESYGEDEDCVKDRAHYIQWPPAAGTAEAPARPEAQLCGFLWRKRWLGQWAKQLFIVREHALLVSIGWDGEGREHSQVETASLGTALPLLWRPHGLGCVQDSAGRVGGGPWQQAPDGRRVQGRVGGCREELHGKMVGELKCIQCPEPASPITCRPCTPIPPTLTP